MACVRGLWVGDSLSALERACIRSFVLRGHAFELYVFDDVSGVPEGCRLLDAASIVPRDRIFVHARGAGRGSLGAFSDLFRYRLLYEHGGWWVDLDVFCLTEQLPDYGVVLARQDARLVNGAVLRFPPRHPLMADALTASEQCSAELEWGEIGPELLTRLVAGHGLAQSVFPPAVFHPVDWQHYWACFDPRRSADVLKRMSTAACLHLWNEMLRRLGIDKNVLPPAGSVLRALYESTIGLDGFRQEYALQPQCPPDALHLEVREYRPPDER